MRTDISTAYDRADLKQLLRKTVWRGRSALRTLLTLLPLAILAVLVGGWSSDPVLELVGYILGGGLLGWLVLITPSTGSRIALWKLRRGGQPPEQTFELADDAFVTRSSNGESRHNWSSIVSVETELERLFVFVTDRCAFIVPKRAFGDETRFDSFSAEASARWKAARA